MSTADPTTGILEIGSLVQKVKDEIIYIVEYYPIESIIACVAVFFICSVMGIAIFRRWDIYDQKLISYYIDGVTSYVGTKMKLLKTKIHENKSIGPLRTLSQNRATITSTKNDSYIDGEREISNPILSPSQRLKQSVQKNKDNLQIMNEKHGKESLLRRSDC